MLLFSTKDSYKDTKDAAPSSRKFYQTTSNPLLLGENYCQAFKQCADTRAAPDIQAESFFPQGYLDKKKANLEVQNNKLERHFYVFVVLGSGGSYILLLRVNCGRTESYFLAPPLFPLPLKKKVYGPVRIIPSCFQGICFLQARQSVSPESQQSLPMESIRDGSVALSQQNG